MEENEPAMMMSGGRAFQAKRRAGGNMEKGGMR